MSRLDQRWYSERVDREVGLVRWGEIGTPVLFFPTAAGDAEEIERAGLVRALAPFLEAGRLKLYSVDSIPGQVWLRGDNRPPVATRALLAFDAVIAEELVPRIRDDCRDPEGRLDLIVAGISVGAYNAFTAICRRPGIFARALCLSGTYDLSKFLEGGMDEAWHALSPLHFLPGLADDDPDLTRLRERRVLLAHGRGRWESPEESWAVAACLASLGVPHDVEEWGEEWDHDWPTWLAMVPELMDEIL